MIESGGDEVIAAVYIVGPWGREDASRRSLSSWLTGSWPCWELMKKYCSMTLLNLPCESSVRALAIL